MVHAKAGMVHVTKSVTQGESVQPYALRKVIHHWATVDVLPTWVEEAAVGRGAR
jgi:hypothetical protein